MIPDDTIKIRIPIATTKSKRPAAAKAFLDYALSEPGAGAVRRLGLPAGRTRTCSQANASKFPEPARPVHDRGPRRLAQGQRRAVRPGRTGSIAKIEEDAGVSTAK